ncbi:hypothetical protein PILCRDRAFT_816174 [Piloderma croceum F 1598]|uniref:Uncharacterized protein n=1 Tax=Piloderma croceum (strain F 1598) TaxID=765440 RepID=A0A0C3G306_PILCF|nr:hypothetical protein PILCRDRAFT_816174 [Piloderma croceum F 1598]
MALDRDAAEQLCDFLDIHHTLQIDHIVQGHTADSRKRHLAHKSEEVSVCEK